MQQSTCRQQFICEESVGESCNICDICQKDTMIQEKDMTEHAKDIVECLISLNRHKSKVKLSELAMTFMGSKAKDIIGQNFHSVPQHGKGKGVFSNIEKAATFIHKLISQSFINENVDCVHDRNTTTYLTCGNVNGLLNNKCQVFYTC